MTKAEQQKEMETYTAGEEGKDFKVPKDQKDTPCPDCPQYDMGKEGAY